MLKRHRWPFPHRAAKSELPVHTDYFRIPVPFHSLHNWREENHHTETFPKKIRPPPPKTKNRYFEDPYYTPLLYVYIYIYTTWAPQNLHFVNNLVFHYRRPASHQNSSHLAFSKAFAFRSGRWNQLTSSKKRVRKKLRQITNPNENDVKKTIIAKNKRWKRTYWILL